jgi:hypothetical protein
MLIELWESLCGYDKWIETDATIASSSLEEVRRKERSWGTYVNYGSADVLIWTDANGREHRAFFRVPQSSPVYKLLGGDTIPIRYNPARPDQFYMRELLQTRANTLAKRILVPLVLIAAGVALAELHRSGYLLSSPSNFLGR